MLGIKLRHKNSRSPKKSHSHASKPASVWTPWTPGMDLGPVEMARLVSVRTRVSLLSIHLDSQVH